MTSYDPDKIHLSKTESINAGFRAIIVKFIFFFLNLQLLGF